MKGCHNCSVSEEIENGIYDALAWDEIPCSSCELAGSAHSYQYDDERYLDAENRVPVDDDDHVLPIRVMGEVLKGLLLLPAAERDTVAMRYSGMKYSDIAEAQGVTMACAEKRHRTAMMRWPLLRNLFPLKDQKQKRRAAKTAESAASIRAEEMGIGELQDRIM